MKKKKKQLDPTIAAVKAARKKSREEELAKYGKQISLYYWVGDKKKHARGGKHKNDGVECGFSTQEGQCRAVTLWQP